jgi:hypothetical protein
MGWDVRTEVEMIVRVQKLVMILKRSISTTRTLCIGDQVKMIYISKVRGFIPQNEVSDNGY